MGCGFFAKLFYFAKQGRNIASYAANNPPPLIILACTSSTSSARKLNRQRPTCNAAENNTRRRAKARNPDASTGKRKGKVTNKNKESIIRKGGSEAGRRKEEGVGPSNQASKQYKSDRKYEGHLIYMVTKCTNV